MSPGPLRRHQFVGGRFVYLVNAELEKNKNACNCEVLYESDWIIDDATVVRPDVMVLCNTPASDFVRVPPVLILEIFSPATRLKDRNVKFKLYEENGVRYYLMADVERNTLETFMLKNNKFEETDSNTFHFSASCSITLDASKLWA